MPGSAPPGSGRSLSGATPTGLELIRRDGFERVSHVLVDAPLAELAETVFSVPRSVAEVRSRVVGLYLSQRVTVIADFDEPVRVSPRVEVIATSLVPSKVEVPHSLKVPA